MSEKEKVPWPLVMPFSTGKHEPELNLSTLSPELKREVWKVINEESPALAELITKAGEAVSHFDGQLLIEHKHLPRRVLEIAGEQS